MLRQARSALVLFRFRYKEERLLRGRTHALLDELVRGAAKPPLQLPAYARVYEVLPRGYVLRVGAAGESLRYVDCIVCVHVTLRVSFVTNVLMFMRLFRGRFRVCCLLICGRSPCDVSSGMNVANTLESVRRLRPPSTDAPERVPICARIHAVWSHAGGGRG